MWLSFVYGLAAESGNVSLAGHPRSSDLIQSDGPPREFDASATRLSRDSLRQTFTTARYARLRAFLAECRFLNLAACCPEQ